MNRDLPAKIRDAESGDDYFEARYYASSMGRFVSPDWSAKRDPVPYAQLDDPQSLNLYAYVRNNPLNGVDPDGHCCWDELKGLAVGAGKSIWNHTVVPASAIYHAVAGITDPNLGRGAQSLGPTSDSESAGMAATNRAIGMSAVLLPGFGGSATVTAETSPIAIETESVSPSVAIPEEGQEVFRVWGGESGPYGHSWTPTNPETVPDFRDVAGLPNVNLGTQLTKGTLTDATGVTSRAARSLDGNKGGAPEYLVPNPKEQIQIRSIKDNTEQPM